MSRIRVPLAVDTQPRIPIGGVQVPIRGLLIAMPASVLAFCSLLIPVPMQLRLALVMVIAVAVIWSTVRSKQGVWVGTHAVYRVASRRAGNVYSGDGWARAAVRFSETSVTSSQRGGRGFLPGRVRQLLEPPRQRGSDVGLLQLSDAGWRAVLRIEGPQTGVSTAEYERWCENLAGWVRSCDCPVQLITRVGHLDRASAERAYDEALDFEPRNGPLVVGQRSFAGEFAALSLAIDHYAVLCPEMARADGNPCAANGIWSLYGPIPTATRGQADRALAVGRRNAETFRLGVEPVPPEKIDELMAQSVAGAREVALSEEGAWLDGRFVTVLTTTRLGPHADHGMVISALQDAEVQGSVALHVLPTARATVRRTLVRRRQFFRYVLREGRSDVDAEVALQDTEALQGELAAGNVAGLRIALTVAVTAETRSRSRDAAARLAAILTDRGWTVEGATVPGGLPLVAVTPGCQPLRRSLLLTTDSVLTRMLPALGTPFSNPADPLLGVNLVSGASAYLNVFSQSNHNLIGVGSSSSGKSTASKMLFAEHVMQGVTGVVVDPSTESEWRGVIQLLGGMYHDLGEEALNPLQIRSAGGLDVSTEQIVTVLSVMAGEEREYVDGQPVRRLAAEEKAWLHREIFTFLKGVPTEGEPVIADLVDHLERVALRRPDLSASRRDAYERVILRLSNYTRGQLGRVFNRPSTFAIDPRVPVGIGLGTLNLAFNADVTPAMAVILTHILAALQRNRGRMVIVLDEAHLVTNDPDAGRLLARVVRQVRHQFGGVWLLSQKVDEFTRTELGRTLAAVASTKLVLGHEEIVAEQVREIFQLSDAEARALTPPVPGQAVVIAGNQRAIVQLCPSPVLWPWLRTGESAREDAA